MQQNDSVVCHLFLALWLIRGSSSQLRVEVDIDVDSDEHVEVERGF
jgi:hypothetical protein